MLYVPQPNDLQCVFYFSSPEIWDPVPSLPTRKQKPKYRTKKKERKNIQSRNGGQEGQGFIKYLCQISGSIPRKRRGLWLLSKLGVLRLNQPVRADSVQKLPAEKSRPFSGRILRAISPKGMQQSISALAMPSAVNSSAAAGKMSSRRVQR